MSISRRFAVSGLLASPFLVRRVKAASAHVVIIGAGAAGLAAAKTLKNAHISFDVIEARHRIGGRAFTDLSLGPRFDAGAFYIHWAERNPWVDIARDLGVATIDDRDANGGFRLAEEGQLLAPGQSARRRFAFAAFQTAAVNRPVEAPDISLAGMAESIGGPEVMAAARAIAVGSLGEEAERVSLADYNRLDSGFDLVVPSGYGALVARHGGDVAVRLSTRAKAIEWGGKGVRVETDQGMIDADAALITVSIGVLQSGRIAFSPALPAATETALNGLGMGAYTKIALHFASRDGFGFAADSTLVSRRADVATLYNMWPHGESVVVAQLGGDRARAIAASGEGAAVQTMLDDLAQTLGAEVRSAFRGGRLANWWHDPFALGSYAIARPGHAGARAALSEPVAERLYFAGEALADKGSMTVGGATLSGREAAERLVLRLLRP